MNARIRNIGIQKTLPLHNSYSRKKRKIATQQTTTRRTKKYNMLKTLNGISEYTSINNIAKRINRLKFQLIEKNLNLLEVIFSL